MAKGKKFKAIEKDVTVNSKFATKSDIGDIEWEGEEIGAESTTKIQDDKGTGIPIILRRFTFAVNPEAFKDHKPTEQELFNSHKNGIMALLWSDEMRPYEAIEPRIVFSKDKSHYTIFVGCIPKGVLNDQTNTLSQLLT